MGITARELRTGVKVRFNGGVKTVEHVALHPAGAWVRFAEGGGASLVALNAYGAVLEGVEA